MQDILSTLLQAVLIAVVPIIAGFVAKGVVALAQYLGVKTDNATVAKYAQEIAQAVEKAQLLLQKAKAAKLERDVLELCAQAYELCVDLPGVRELMPPPAPATEDRG